MSQYLNMVKTNIREFVLNNRYKTLAKIQEHARRRELALETQRNENRWTIALSQPTTKKFKSDELRYGGQRVPRCNMCGKSHKGVSHALICLKCDKEGHYNRYYKQEAYGVRTYFYYNHMGHMKANCPLLNPIGIIQAFVPATLRITDGQQGKVKALRDKGRAFQLMVEEAREAR